MLSTPNALTLASLPFELALLLATEAYRAASRRANLERQRRRPKRGLTLQPGPDTPLWNELVRQVRPHLRRYGAKNELARILEVPRQRVYLCITRGQAALDAERTLLLLAWLCRRRRPRRPAVKGK